MLAIKKVSSQNVYAGTAEGQMVLHTAYATNPILTLTVGVYPGNLLIGLIAENCRLSHIGHTFHGVHAKSGHEC